ncbi:MAG TPA: hypothetical protein VI008_03620 [Rubrobacter sp.]
MERFRMEHRSDGAPGWTEDDYLRHGLGRPEVSPGDASGESARPAGEVSALC